MTFAYPTKQTRAPAATSKRSRLFVRTTRQTTSRGEGGGRVPNPNTGYGLEYEYGYEYEYEHWEADVRLASWYPGLA